MILIIDGYNVIFNENWPYSKGNLEQQRHSLVEAVAKYRYQCDLGRVILVFDGLAGIGPYNKTQYIKGIEIIYAVCSGKADEQIVHLSRGLNGVVVITADRALVKKVKRYKSDTMDPEDFIFKLCNLPKYQANSNIPPQQSEKEIEEWLEAFDLSLEVEIPKANSKKLPKVPQQKPSKKDSPKSSKKMPKGTKEWMEWFGFSGDEEYDLSN